LDDAVVGNSGVFGVEDGGAGLEMVIENAAGDARFRAASQSVPPDRGIRSFPNSLARTPLSSSSAAEDSARRFVAKEFPPRTLPQFCPPVAEPAHKRLPLSLASRVLARHITDAQRRRSDTVVSALWG